MRTFLVASISVILSLRVFSQNTGSAYFPRNTGTNTRIRVADVAPVHPSANPGAYQISGGNISMEMWVFPMELPGMNQGSILIRRPSNTGFTTDPYMTFDLSINNYTGSDEPRFAMEITDGTTPITNPHVFVRDTAAPRIGEWTHVAGTYDGATAKLYINGGLVAQQTFSLSMGSGSTGLYIGGTYFQSFEGLIDEVRLWNITRTQAEIQSKMNTTLIGNESGLVGYWKFDETAGAAIAVDATANHNDLNVQNGATFVNSPANTAVSFVVQIPTPWQRLVAGDYISRSWSALFDAYPSVTINGVDATEGVFVDWSSDSLFVFPSDTGNFKIRLKLTHNGQSKQFEYTGGYVDAYPTYARTHNNNNAVFTSFNNGKFGAQLSAAAYGETGPEGYSGVGFVFNGQNGLFEGSLMIGKSSTQVLGNLFTYGYDYATGDTTATGTLNLPGFAQGFQNSYTDARSTNPIGLAIEQITYSKATAPDDDYVIMEYRIRNTSLADLTGLYVGLNMDLDVSLNANVDRGGYDAARRLSYIYENGGASNPNYYGVVALNGTISGQSIYQNGIVHDDQDSAMFRIMTSGPMPPPGFDTDVRSLIAVGPYNIPRFGVINVQFAVVGGIDLADLQANADRVLSVIAANPDPAPVIKLGVLASDVTDQIKIAIASDQSLAFARTIVNSKTVNMKSLDGRTWMADYTLTAGSNLMIQANTTDYEGSSTAASQNYSLSKAKQLSKMGDFDVTSLSEEGFVLSTTRKVRMSQSRIRFLEDGLWCVATLDDQEARIQAAIPSSWLDELKKTYKETYDERKVGLYVVEEENFSYTGGESESGKLSVVLNLSKTGQTFAVAYDPDHVVLPKELTLYQNFPNPFNPTTEIRFFLPERARVTVQIYNVLGQEVRTLLAEDRPGGFHQIVWNGRNDSEKAVASGMYFYTVRTPARSITRRMLLVK